MKTAKVVGALGFVWGIASVGGGCNSGPAEPLGGSLAARSSAVTSSAPPIPGYEHVVEASKFHLGANVHTDTFGAFSRWVGDDAVFAVNQFSGMVIATQDSSSPARAVTPYSTDMATHAAFVRSYFLSAGLPADQVAAVGSSTKSRGSGVAGGPPAIGQFVAYDATLSRAIAGFQVTESLAEAQFNANGESVRETVYWPALPASVVSDAAAIAAALKDPVAGPAYRAKIPLATTSTSVNIHHTSGILVEPTPFVVFASCDVPDGELVRHFDIAGHELVLPNEGGAQ
jgi:hypothetical protein